MDKVGVINKEGTKCSCLYNCKNNSECLIVHFIKFWLVKRVSKTSLYLVFIVDDGVSNYKHETNTRSTHDKNHVYKE